MLAESSYRSFSLSAGEALSLHRTAGWEVVCLTGRVWLTEEGGEDIWLDPGERYGLRRHGRLVIEASTAASLRLCLPPSAWRLPAAEAVGALARFCRRVKTMRLSGPIIPGRG